MSRLQLQPTIFSDLALIELRMFERNALDAGKLHAIANACMCWTAIYNEKILAIIGFREVMRGVLEVFVIPSIHVPDYPQVFVRGVLRLLNRVSEDIPDVHRMHTFSVANDETDRWMEVLGFKCEGVLEKWDSAKHNYKLWARVK